MIFYNSLWEQYNSINPSFAFMSTSLLQEQSTSINESPNNKVFNSLDVQFSF